MAAQLERVAILGADAAVHGMATRLLRAGIRTIVCSRDSATASSLWNRGATVTATVEEAASQAGVAITMVPDINELLAIADERGMLDALPRGAIWAQMSTIGVAPTQRVAELVESRRPDVMLVDAPLSGPDGTPEQRGLTIFASGPERAQARIASVFDALGPRTIWMGPVGLGSRMKVVNNTLLAFIAEAIALAHNIELAAEAVMDAGAAGPPTSPAANAAIRRTARGENAPARSLALALQDVGLALDAAGHDRSPVLAQLAGSWSPS